jgi:hypothetical protein
MTTDNDPLLVCNEPLSVSSGALPDSFLSQNQPFFALPTSHGQMPANFVLPTSWLSSVVTASFCARLKSGNKLLHYLHL